MPRTFVSGSSEYFYASAAVATVHPLSMACRFRSADTGNGMSAVSVSYAGGAHSYWALQVRWDQAGDKVKFYADDAAANAQPVSKTAVSAATWAIICAVEGSNILHYAGLDGTLGTVDTTDVTPTAGQVNRTAIGTRINSGGAQELCDADLMWAAIWKCQLSTLDVQRLGYGVDPFFVRRDSLVFYVPMMYDEDFDRIGGNSLTVSGTPTVSYDFPDTMVRAMPRGRGRGRIRFS